MAFAPPEQDGAPQDGVLTCSQLTVKGNSIMDTQLNDSTAKVNAKNTLVKSALLLMVLTVVSKLFGFAREMTQAYYFGADMQTDAYLVAMTIPTVLFLAVSTSINNVFIPTYDRFKALGRDKALVWRFTQLAFVLTVLTFVVPVFLNTKLAVRLFAPEFPEEAITLAAGMLRILIFMIFFRLFSAIGTAVLHVNRNFLVPGAVGIPYSLIIIGFSFFLSGSMGINALVWGTLASVGVQFLTIMPWLLRTKMGGSIRDNVSDGLREIAVLLPPVLAGTLAGQAKTMTDRMFASSLAEGSISYLNYALRIKDLPVGLLVITVLTVLYPTIVTHANNKEWGKYRSTVAGALNTMTFLMLPIMAGLIILALPITQLIYQRGEFSPQASVATAYALQFYGPLLLGTMLYNLMVKSHYAIRDTKTPLIAMLISVSANIVLNAVFIRYMAHGGLALATSLATLSGAVYMYIRLSKVTGPLVESVILKDMAKSVLATLVMAVVCLGAYRILLPRIPEAFLGRALYTGGIIAVSAGIYFVLAWMMKISAMDEARNLLRRAQQRISNRT